MKKILLLFIIIVFISSCKKRYNCTCVTTFTYAYTSNSDQKNYSSATNTISKKTSKKQAQAICDHEAKSINDTHINYSTNSGNYPLVAQNYSTECSLK